MKAHGDNLQNHNHGRSSRNAPAWKVRTSFSFSSGGKGSRIDSSMGTCLQVSCIDVHRVHGCDVTEVGCISAAALNEGGDVWTSPSLTLQKFTREILSCRTWGMDVFVGEIYLGQCQVPPNNRKVFLLLRVMVNLIPGRSG